MAVSTGQFARLPFLNGVYVAVDAVDGAFLIVDGPYCVFTKAQIQYGHNLRCRLIPPLGRARVVHTAAKTGMEEVTSLSLDRRAAVEKLFAQVCGYEEAQVVFATSFDFHTLLNFPLPDIARHADARYGKPVCHIPSASLRGGSWLDGYAAACEALARRIPLARGRKGRDKVAVVGYLFDRDEPDHAGNLRELRRLFRALGLDLVSVWLGGRGLPGLREVERAGAIVSLPYARAAARVLGARLKIPVIEAGLPMGLTGTEAFLTAVGDALRRGERARRFLKRELPALVRQTQDPVWRVIRGRAAALACGHDPHLSGALAGLCSDLGLLLPAPGAAAAASPGGPASLAIGPNLRIPRPDVIPINFGYPNYADHPVVEKPFLGFSGFCHWVDRLTAAILQFEAADPRRRPAPEAKR